MKIAIIGYGKMGHMIEDVALSRGHEIVCRIDSSSHNSPSKDIDIVPPEAGFDSDAFRSADVAIEFTAPSSARANILRAWAQSVPVVCGTTGWDIKELYATYSGGKEIDSNKVIIRDDSGAIKLVWSSNFSVGVTVFFELNKVLAHLLTESKRLRDKNDTLHYTPSITEIHHIHKLDKPSGTAKTLAEQIEGTEVPIESIREGEVPGTHMVTWDSPEDTIVITHIAKGRMGFALGAVMAAEEIAKIDNN